MKYISRLVGPCPLVAFFAGFMLLAILAAPALAQTGTLLLMEPWRDRTVNLTTDLIYIDGADTDGLGDDVDIAWWEASGRWNVDDSPVMGWALGFSATWVDFTSDNPDIPDQLIDSAATIGLRVGDFEMESIGRFTLGVVGTIGYAGEDLFDDWDGYYFAGDVVFVHELNVDSRLIAGINYDGNRAIWPDIPLPFGAWQVKWDDYLTTVLGFPYSRVVWHPFQNSFYFDGSFFVFLDGEFEVGARLPLGINPFAGYYAKFNGYTAEDTREDRRLFLRQRRLEAGVRVNWKMIQATIAGGWAFDQEIEVGWDVRDLDSIVEIDDEFYIRLGGRIEF